MQAITQLVFKRNKIRETHTLKLLTLQSPKNNEPKHEKAEALTQETNTRLYMRERERGILNSKL